MVLRGYISLNIGKNHSADSDHTRLLIGRLQMRNRPLGHILILKGDFSQT